MLEHSLEASSGFTGATGRNMESLRSVRLNDPGVGHSRALAV